MVYAHLSQVFVAKGQFVRKGDLLGLSGHTGYTSGPHVHVEMQTPGWPNGAQVDFTNLLSTIDYSTNPWAGEAIPLATGSGALELRGRPDANSGLEGTLTAPAATWLNSAGDATDSKVLSVGSDTLSLELTGSTVELAVSNVTFAGTNGSYMAVTEGSLPANLRPPVRTPTLSAALKALKDNKENESQEVQKALEALEGLEVYVSQNGQIYYRNTAAGSVTVAEVLDATLTWDLAYSVIGTDRVFDGKNAAASWWQIVVPGLDEDANGNPVEGVVGWVPGSAVTVPSPGQVRITWPPPPTPFEGIGTLHIPSPVVPVAVPVSLSWQAPDNYGGDYRILRGSSPKTLIGRDKTSKLSWTENILSNETYYYAVAGAAGTGTSVRSLVAKVGSGSLPPSPQKPMLTVIEEMGVRVRRAPEIADNIIVSLSKGTSVVVLAHNGGDESRAPNDGGLWWEIEYAWKKDGETGNSGWVAHRFAASTDPKKPDANVLVKVSKADQVPLFVDTEPDGTDATGGMGGRGHELYINQPDPAGPEPVPTAGRLYARQGLSAGGVGDRLRAWPASDATELTASLQADVWYTVDRLFARTGPGDLWLEVAPHSAIPSGSAAGPSGWVAAGRLSLAASGTPPLPPAARFVRLRSWVTAGANVRSGPGKAYARRTTLRDRAAWHPLLGRNAEATWYRIGYATGQTGWIYEGLVDLLEPVAIPLAALSIQTVSHRPAAEPGPTGETGVTETGTTSGTGQAKGDFRNLATNPDGRWSVSKTGRTASLSFDCPRSPVQYYARQNPQPQFVLPEAFRPTRTVTRTVTGTEVDEHRKDLPNAPSVTFTVRVETDGEVRYVDNSQVDHVGYVRYGVQGWSYATATTLAEPEGPAAPGDLEDSGTYHNRQVNWGSRWELEREEDDVEGSFTTTRSPVEYYANQNREALIWLPAEFWPEEDARFQVRGAVRVNEDGTDDTDTRTVDFWITVRASDGRMYYDQDASLATQGVGYLRYSVNVDWEASPRVTVPSAPRNLEADDIEADAVELDWDRPAEDGGDSVDEYKVEIYRNGRWREEEDDISRTRHDVEGLSAYTRYSFRVLARNSAGWSAPSTALTVTTLREQPGQPRSLTAAATHETVTLNWQAPASGGTVTGYRIQRQEGSGTWDTLVPNTRATTPGWTDRDVRAGTGYGYRVAAYNYGALGRWSGTRRVSTAATPTVPGQVTALAAGPGAASRLELSWTEPGDTGGGVTGYRVERAADAMPRSWATRVADTGTAATRWGDDAVAADTVYHYRVSACNSAGVGTASAEAEGQSRPQLQLPRQVRYPLTAHSEPRSDAAVAATFSAYQPGEAYELVGQAPGPEGWWRLQLLDPAFAEAVWLPAAAGQATGATTALPSPPAAAGDFVASLANGEATLSWSAPTTGAAVSGYRLWRQTDDGAWAQLGADLAATVLTYTDSTVGNGHVYRYRLQGLSAEGPGVPTAWVALAVTATVAAPEAVTALTAVATTTTLALSWTKASTGGLVGGYRVAWREADTDDFYWAVTVAGTSHTLTNLRPGTGYALRVTAFNQEGEAAVTTGLGTTVQVAPGAPDALTVTVAANAATVSWTAPEAGGRPDEYHLQSRLPGAAWPATHRTLRGTSHTLRDLAYETGYEVQVRASNTAGESAWVGTSFTTAAAPPVPGTPADLTAAPGPDSQMVLAWTAPATGGPVAGYRIERAVAADPLVWTEAVADTGDTATTWRDGGLPADTVHHYRVTARNAGGLGTPSATAQGRTRPQLALKADATYPLTAHRWPAAEAPATHTWVAHDAAAALDVVGRADGWWRVLRFGEGAGGPYWLPAAAATVTGGTADVPQAPGTPGALAATATDSSATLTWTAPATGGPVTGYRLWRGTGEADLAVLGDDLAAGALAHVDTGLTAETTYRYRLQALSAAGAGPRTAAVAVTTAAALPAPGMPADLTAAPGPDSQMVLAWTAPTAGGPVTGYRIERAAAADPLVWTEATADTGSAATTWNDGGLPADTVHHYRVTARNAGGLGAPSATAQGRTRPQGRFGPEYGSYPLTAHAWPEASAPVTHIWPAADASAVHDLAGRRSGGDRWYRLLRFGQAADGPYWVPAEALATTGAARLPEVPEAARRLAAVAAHSHVLLTWQAPATGGTVTGYRLWRRTGATGPFTVLGTDLAAAVLRHVDDTVAAGAHYAYRLQALADAGAGPRTEAVAVAVPLAGPTAPQLLATPPDLQGVQTGTGALQLRWDAVAAAAAYEVRLWQAWTDPATQRQHTRWVTLAATGATRLQTGPDTHASLTLALTGTLATVAGWPAGYAPWRLAVRATGAAGISAWSDSLDVPTGAAPYRPPAPAGLTAAATAAGAATLTWDAVAGATAYVVQHDFPPDAAGRGGGWQALPHRGATLTLTGTTATVAGLPPADALRGRFRVQARNAAGLSLPSLSASPAPARP